MTPDEFRAGMLEALQPLAQHLADNWPTIERVYGQLIDHMVNAAENYANTGGTDDS